MSNIVQSRVVDFGRQRWTREGLLYRPARRLNPVRPDQWYRCRCKGACNWPLWKWNEAIQQFVAAIAVTAKGKGTVDSGNLTIASIAIAEGASVFVSVIQNTTPTATCTVTWNGISLTSNKSITYLTHNKIWLFTLHGVTGATGSVVVTPANSYELSATVSQVTGLAASPVDQSASASGRSTTPSSGASDTTTQADELLFGVVGNDIATDPGGTWDDSFVALQGQGGSSSRYVRDAYKVVSATAAYTASITGDTKDYWTALIVTYKAATAYVEAFSGINLGMNRGIARSMPTQRP